MKKANELATLESVITKPQTEFITQPDDEYDNMIAIRVTSRENRLDKTHTLKLNKRSANLYWHNHRGKHFGHQFNSIEQANEWWNRMIMPRVKQPAKSLS